MADNVPITAGSGTNVATDDVAGVHFQRVKLVDGTLDSSTAIPGDATNGLDVDVTRVQGSVTVAQATAASLNATVAAGSGFPGVATDGSAIISTGTLSMGTDGTNAQTMRMSTAGEQYVFIGGDDGAGGFQTASFDATLTDAETNSVSHLNVHSRGAVWNPSANAGAGGWDRVRGDTTNGMDVDVTRVSGNVTVVQATGSNLNAVVSGTVTANLAAGTNNIGDVDVLTVPAPLSTSGGGTEASALRVTIANNSTGVVAVTDNGTTLSVDDGGGILTVDGTVTANAGTGFGVVSLPSTSISQGPLIMGSDGTNARAVQTTTGGILKVDGSATTQPVSGTVTVTQATAGNLNANVSGTVTANLAAGTNNIGDVDVLTVPAPLNVTGGGTEASALRVTIANDSTGVLSVDDNGTTLSVDDGGGSLTVDGTVTVTQATAGNLNATVTAGSGFGIATAAATASTTGPQIMGSDGTLARAIQTTTGGVLKVDGSATTQPVSGTVTANAGTGSFTVAQATAANLNATVTGTVTANAGTGSFTVSQATAANLNATVVQSTAANLNATVVQATASNLNAQAVGSIAHGTSDSGNPVKVGAKAIAHGTNPTAVAAASRTDLYANRAGVLFVIGGHPNVQTIRTNLTTSSTLTNNALITVAAGLKIVVTRVSVVVDKATTVNVSARVGFGAAATPTTTGVLLSHPGIAAGSGMVEGNGSGILGVGADGEDVFGTFASPTTGSIDVVISYYTIES